MAYPVKFDGANSYLGPPPGSENVTGLYTFTNGVNSVSCWELSEAEIAEILKTKRVFLSALSGRSQPPVFVGGEEETRSMCADYGVWRRGNG